ncbi:Hypothetical protein GLP15_1404 [Giardia lamblia P15]|uniref:Uncharacterized protein n=1 Tax=Giardia intestinalis (strain P15) TaxID=658858 RepID=E1F4W4_GIAIA|nr:Hypothetical protein GLP15_1404 [Giardia lamblia P15]
MNSALHWSLWPLPTVASAFHFVLDNISNRLLNTVSFTEYEATIDATKCLIENAIDVLKDASDAEILVHASILNSVVVCVLKHFFLNPSNLELYTSSQFDLYCQKLNELRKQYFTELLGASSMQLIWSRLFPVVKNSLVALGQAKCESYASVHILTGALLFDLLHFPLEDLLSVLYNRKSASFIVANLLLHLPTFASLSFVKPTVHLWGANAVYKKLIRFRLFASTLHWLCRPSHIILLFVSRGQKDSLLPQPATVSSDTGASYFAYLRFTCDWGAQALSASLYTSYSTSSLDTVIRMLSEYPILTEPDEYIILCELLSSTGMQAYAKLLGLNAEDSVLHPTANPYILRNLIVRLRTTLAESCYDVTNAISAQALIEHLISVSTKSRDQLISPAITITCFSLVTCYFNLSAEAALGSFALSRDPNRSIVKAIFQFETFILVALHGCILDAFCNFKEQGRWLELHPVLDGNIHYMQSPEEIKIPIHKILTLPLSYPTLELFRSMTTSSSKQSRLKTTKGRPRTPVLCTHECKFVVMIRDMKCELSLFELLIWDLHHLELSQLVSHIQYLWNYNWNEAEKKLRTTMQMLNRTFGISGNIVQLSSQSKAPDSDKSTSHYMNRVRATTRDQIELVARAELMYTMKRIGSIQLIDVLQIYKHSSDNKHSVVLSCLEPDMINRLVAWGIENGYFKISGHNPQMLYYIN